jgi:site-specific DNA-cytosine methylase
MSTVPVRHGHMCCGMGAGAKGMNRSTARVGQMHAKMQCVGGIDVDPAGVADFHRMTGVKATLLDMFDREQYTAFHGRPPPDGWREATPADVRGAYSDRPHIMFTSMPCKGFSGLTSETKSLTPKYQALNNLTLRCIWLLLEAFQDDPMEFFVFENVPRIQTRGRWLLDQIIVLLRSYGYAVAETTHDCGELGGLAQSRKRFLLVARHAEKVPPFLYEPVRKPLRGVGEVLGLLPMPGDPIAGALHRIPKLQWKTWVRLAFVQAGKDWRSLNRLAVEDGMLRDYAIAPATNWQGGVLGVHDWRDAAGVVTGRSSPTTGAFSVADPRFDSGGYNCGQYGVDGWDQTVGAVIGVKSPGQGGFAVADPRMPDTNPNRQNGLYRVVRYDSPANVITGANHAAGGAQAVADPRQPGPLFAKYAVTAFDEPAGTVISGSTTGQGAYAVADPRPPGLVNKPGDVYATAGAYGVVQWTEPSGAIAGAMQHDNGRACVADARLPEPADSLACVIVAEDNTWHRPFTTLDMGALQSLFDPEEFMHFQMHGTSDSAIRERIGNAVPCDSAEAIGSVMARTLLLAWSGETFILSAEPIWVAPLITAIQCGSVA